MRNLFLPLMLLLGGPLAMAAPYSEGGLPPGPTNPSTVGSNISAVPGTNPPMPSGTNPGVFPGTPSQPLTPVPGAVPNAGASPLNPGANSLGATGPNPATLPPLNYDPSRVQMTTLNGQIVLQGTVNSQAEANMLLQNARAANAGSDVINNLQIEDLSR